VLQVHLGHGELRSRAAIDEERDERGHRVTGVVGGMLHQLADPFAVRDGLDLVSVLRQPVYQGTEQRIGRAGQVVGHTDRACLG